MIPFWPQKSIRSEAAPTLPFTRIVAPSFVQKLRSRDDRFDQAAECIPVGRQPGPHLGEGFVVRGEQAAAQRVRKQLPAQVIDEIVLTFIVQILAQTREAVPIFSVGE